MLASQRRTLILEALERTGGVRVSDLTVRFGVSDMTVRRDLELMESHGWLRKVHGGAIAVASSSEEPTFETKQLLHLAAKRAIAARAAEFVEPGSAIGISAGSTTSVLAQMLDSIDGPLSIVTNSTTVADALAKNSSARDHTIILTGGVRTPSAALVGSVADRSIGSLYVDRLFLGVHGMHPVAGLTSPNMSEAHTNAAFIARARQLIVVADSSKWGTVGLAEIAPLTSIDVLITDEGLPPPARDVLGDAVGELIIVPVLDADADAPGKARRP